MLDIKTPLPEVKKLVIELSEDLLARSIENAGVDAGLREAYTQIEMGGRTADPFEVWRENDLDQVAVAWVLACVFVRFLEDNHLIDECWLAGEDERRKLAEDTQCKSLEFQDYSQIGTIMKNQTLRAQALVAHGVCRTLPQVGRDIGSKASVAASSGKTGGMGLWDRANDWLGQLSPRSEPEASHETLVHRPSVRRGRKHWGGHVEDDSDDAEDSSTRSQVDVA